MATVVFSKQFCTRTSPSDFLTFDCHTASRPAVSVIRKLGSKIAAVKKL